MTFDGPRLRRDLVSTILQSEDGVRCVDVCDPKLGSTFRLFGYEYSVALAFDGRPLSKVIAWVRLSTGLELTVEQLMAFADRLTSSASWCRARQELRVLRLRIGRHTSRA